jgi:type II secretory pathway component PulJ
MNSDAQITLGIAIAVWIFTAGGLLTWAKMSINQLEKDAMFRTAELRKELERARADLYRDINGIGNRVKADGEAASRRYYNLSMSLLIAAPQSKETELCGLLREGN